MGAMKITEIRNKVPQSLQVCRKDWNSALYRAMPFYQNIEKDGVVL